MTTHSESHPEQPEQQLNYDQYVHYVVPPHLTGALKSYEVMLNYSMPKLPDIKMPPGIKWPAHIENHLKMTKTIKSPIHDYMTIETALSKQIREMNQVLFKPNETMVSLMAKQTQLVTSISAAESAWQKLHKPVVFDGTFTIPTYIAHFQRTSALTLWSQQYGAMYMRIAEELRRQRIELSNMLDSIKQLPQIEELEQLMFEHEGACNFANSVHKRLCEIEKITCSRSFSSLGFVDEFVAELRLDHAEMDDSLTRIGEIPTSQLMGQNELVARTWYRLRLFSTELKRIDNDLNWLVQQIFA